MSKYNRYRTDTIKDHVIGFSVSYDKQDLLRRGIGIEHLRELLLRLARPHLRQGANIAYGGHWQESPENLTYDLLRVISAEQEDQGAVEQLAESDSESKPKIGKLYNHSAWPNYLAITPHIEAQWISSCRIVRVDQRMAGLRLDEIVADVLASTKEDPRVAFNSAVTLSAMRRAMMRETLIELPIPNTPPERIPAVVARILLGGKPGDYSGFMPGIFEEALVTLRAKQPTFILGGFGGASETLAMAMLEPHNSARPPQLTLDWHRARTPKLATLLDASAGFRLPDEAMRTPELLDDLYSFVEQARIDLPGTLNTCLDAAQTRELMTTRNVPVAVRLVREGLAAKNQLRRLPG